jgi:hypothetical protein
MDLEDLSIQSPVERKIAWANQAFDILGERLEADPEVAALLKRLEGALLASQEAMERAGITALCRICEEEDGGSCCGAGIENRYDAVLLLINRLLGVALPDSRRVGKTSCFFLGDEGCLLDARQVICVNYICDIIQMKIEPAELNALREEEGRALDATFLLHKRISALIRKDREAQ